MVTHDGINKSDIFMCCDEEDPNLLILSRDRICFARLKSKEDKRIKCVDLKSKESASYMLDCWNDVLQTWSERTTINRKILIQALQAMDSETVTIKTGDDTPLIVVGKKNDRDLAIAIANIDPMEEN